MRNIHNPDTIFQIANSLGLADAVYGDIDKMEAAIMLTPPVHCPIKETITDQMYGRECTLPYCVEGIDAPVDQQLGTVHVSGIHLQQHQYVVISGAGRVFEINPSGVKMFEFDCSVDGPFFGVTEANTRRVLFITRPINNDLPTVWKTFHPNVLNVSPDELLSMIISKRENPLISQSQLTERRSAAMELQKKLSQ